MPAIVAMIAVVVLYAWHASLFWPYVNDDAYITFRYSRFLAMGRGPYFNVGEHVEGYTNFTTMLGMAGIYRLFGPAAVPLAAKATGVLSGIATIVMAAKTTPSLTR